MKDIVVIGYDQGIANAGICVLQYNMKKKKRKILFKAHFTTSSKIPEQNRIKMHYDFLTKIIKKYKPKAIACEKLMNNTVINKRNKSASMMTVNMISSIVMLTAAQNNIQFKEYMPMTVKKRFTGTGKADKEQMIEMAMKKYKLRKKPIEHIADAVGIAETLLYDYINK